MDEKLKKYIPKRKITKSAIMPLCTLFFSFCWIKFSVLIWITLGVKDFFSSQFKVGSGSGFFSDEPDLGKNISDPHPWIWRWRKSAILYDFFLHSLWWESFDGKIGCLCWTDWLSGDKDKWRRIFIGSQRQTRTFHGKNILYRRHNNMKRIASSFRQIY